MNGLSLPIRRTWALQRPGVDALGFPLLAAVVLGLYALFRAPVLDPGNYLDPCGAVDAGDDPERAARRELREETGCEAGELIPLGPLLVDSGRQETVQWAYFAPAVRVVDAHPDSGEPLETLFVAPTELKRLIVDGEFDLGAHIGIVGRAGLAGLLTL